MTGRRCQEQTAKHIYLRWTGWTWRSCQWRVQSELWWCEEMYVFCMGKKESLKNTISSSVYWFKLQCVSLKERKSWYMIQSSSFIFIMRFNYFHYSIIIMSVVHLSVKKPGKIIIISSQETGFKFRWCSQRWRCNLDTVDLDDLHTKCFGVFFVCVFMLHAGEWKKKVILNWSAE